MIIVIMWKNERRVYISYKYRTLSTKGVSQKVGTLEDSDKSSVMIQFLMGALGFLEMEPHIQMNAFMNPTS